MPPNSDNNMTLLLLHDVVTVNEKVICRPITSLHSLLTDACMCLLLLNGTRPAGCSRRQWRWYALQPTIRRFLFSLCQSHIHKRATRNIYLRTGSRVLEAVRRTFNTAIARLNHEHVKQASQVTPRQFIDCLSVVVQRNSSLTLVVFKRYLLPITSSLCYRRAWSLYNRPKL